MRKNLLKYVKTLGNKEEIVVAATSAWGGCDVPFWVAEKIGVKKIVHVGHNNCFGLSSVEFIPYELDVSPRLDELLEKLSALNVKKVSIGASLQYLKLASRVEYFLVANGIKVRNRVGRCGEKYQILGCDVSTLLPDVDAYVIITDGYFHALSSLDEKPTFRLDPFTGKVEDMTPLIRKEKRKRMALLEKARNACVFGILVSIKPGQYNMEAATQVKKLLEEKGRKALIFVGDELSPEVLNDFLEIDCWINTACPRLIDDAERFFKPIINLDMFSQLLRQLE